MEKIAIGSDHGGFELKQEMINHYAKQGLKLVDLGCYSPDAVDYPDVAEAMCAEILSNKADLGILICGSGIGISIAANKMKGIRCALCSDCFSAEATRLHNNTNIIALGGRVVGPELAVKIVDTFLNTPFSNDERHIRRINMIE